MRPSTLLTTAALLCTPCFAWPARPEEAQNIDARALEERQQTSTSYNLNFSGVQGNTATTLPSATASASAVVTTNSAGSTVTLSATAAGNSGGNATSSADSGNSSQPVFDPRLPAGGIALITPNTALAVPTYYKIRDWVTFAWNYTSLSVTPSAVDVLASCSANHATYTIATNQTIPTDGAQTVLWDTGAFQASATIPLLTETYTLIIKEAGQPVTARASAGYLAPFSGLTFGMYSPKAMTPLADFVCVGCSDAITNMERQTILTILGVAGVTIASFTWFTGIVGMW